MDHFNMYNDGEPHAPIVEGEMPPLAVTEEGSQGPPEGGNGEGNGARTVESNGSENDQPVLTSVVSYPNVCIPCMYSKPKTLVKDLLHLLLCRPITLSMD